jgi:hypothetical protein
MSNPEALVFDVFGTVVDWRSTIIRVGEKLGGKKSLDADWAAFADAWGSDPKVGRILLRPRRGRFYRAGERVSRLTFCSFAGFGPSFTSLGVWVTWERNGRKEFL